MLCVSDAVGCCAHKHTLILVVDGDWTVIVAVAAGLQPTVPASVLLASEGAVLPCGSALCATHPTDFQAMHNHICT